MRRTVELDAELEKKLAQAASAAKQDPAVVLLEAVRVGLPSLAMAISAPRPDGFFRTRTTGIPKGRRWNRRCRTSCSGRNDESSAVGNLEV